MSNKFCFFVFLPKFLNSYTVLQVQVVSLVLLEFLTVIVHLDKAWSFSFNIFTFFWRKPQDLHEENRCHGLILHVIFSRRHKIRPTRFGSMPECKMVSTTFSVSFSVSGLYKSNNTWMLLSLARYRSSSKEGMVWFLAICRTSSERLDTERKGSVWKVRKQMSNAISNNNIKSMSALFVLNVIRLTSMNHFPAFRLCNSSQVKSALWLKTLSGNLFSISVVLRRNPELWSCIRKGTLSLLEKELPLIYKPFDDKTIQIQRFVFH